MTDITEILTNKNFPKSNTSRLDLELILAKTLHKSRSFLYTNPEHELTSDQEKIFQNLYQRRLQGEPIAYILEKKEFWSLELMINSKVLIPRPETEVLVETILQKLTSKQADVADLGTGSGAIALAIANEKPCWNIVATDISNEALQVAKNNADKLNIQNIDFYNGSWCHALPKKKFDAILSNPPYIAKHDPHLKQGDVRFEPKIALESGDGLDAIKQIIIQAKNNLKPGGWLIIEHGYDQKNMVKILLHQENYQQITHYKDIADIDRIVAARL